MWSKHVSLSEAMKMILQVLWNHSCEPGDTCSTVSVIGPLTVPHQLVYPGLLPA